MMEDTEKEEDSSKFMCHAKSEKGPAGSCGCHAPASDGVGSAGQASPKSLEA